MVVGLSAIVRSTAWPCHMLTTAKKTGDPLSVPETITPDALSPTALTSTLVAPWAKRSTKNVPSQVASFAFAYQLIDCCRSSNAPAGFSSIPYVESAVGSIP